ncbi:hypothetical protein SK128_011218 [Halocaridina rubra]|uniref:Uncharacterized protein n=1 Tax=Halocaridina rubra TaxID=373956 RepID=A0AAN9AEA2_HALRR
MSSASDDDFYDDESGESEKCDEEKEESDENERKKDAFNDADQNDVSEGDDENDERKSQANSGENEGNNEYEKGEDNEGKNSVNENEEKDDGENEYEESEEESPFEEEEIASESDSRDNDNDNDSEKGYEENMRENDNENEDAICKEEENDKENEQEMNEDDQREYEEKAETETPEKLNLGKENEENEKEANEHEEENDPPYESSENEKIMNENDDCEEDELERIFRSSQSHVSPSSSSSPAKMRRERPRSAKSQMKVLIRQLSSPCSSGDSKKALVFDHHEDFTMVNDCTNNYYNIRPRASNKQPRIPGIEPLAFQSPVTQTPRSHQSSRNQTPRSQTGHTPAGTHSYPPPLLVTKSPVHDRPIPARRSRENTPRSSSNVGPASPAVADCSESPSTSMPERVSRPGTAKISRQGSLPPEKQQTGAATGRHQLSSTSRGINRVLSSKEKDTTGQVGPPNPRPKSAVTQPKIMDRGVATSKHRQPRHRPLGDYSRSLQMLGVKLPAPLPKTPKTPRSSSSQSWKSEGTLHTRVKKRSTSLEDVTRAIPQVKDPETLRDLQVGE